jgi:hypothetical protein
MFSGPLASRPVAENRGAEAIGTGGGTGRFRRARSLGPGGKGARHDIGLEELGRSGAHRRGYLNSEGLEGSEGPKLEGSQGCTGAGWSSRRCRLGRGAAGRGDARLLEVQQSTSAQREEQRWVVSGRRERKGGARRRCAPFNAA